MPGLGPAPLPPRKLASRPARIAQDQDHAAGKEEDPAGAGDWPDQTGADDKEHAKHKLRDTQGGVAAFNLHHGDVGAVCWNGKTDARESFTTREFPLCSRHFRGNR